jgi:hypothetical protein
MLLAPNRARPRPSWVFAWLSLAACAGSPSQVPQEATIAFPTTLGEGSPQPGKEPRRHRAAPSPSAAAPPSASAAASADPSPGPPPSATVETVGPAASPPDPEPLRMAEQWEYEISSEQGALAVSSVKAVTLREPAVTPRRMGRYAIELWIGHELVERVRFDLPLLGGGEEPPKPTLAPPGLEKGVHARTRVLVPRSPRARRALLVDRAEGRATPLPWPPDRSRTP